MEREPPEEPESERERRLANLVLLGGFAVMVAIGLWLANAMVEQRDIDNCVAQGRRNCSTVDAPAR
ncbi:MAG: hypothetical protein IT537_07920 [Hyphomicrobiales bacterium]|nr:hypothetical protein [Hyphomicrobiales bacterium]